MTESGLAWRPDWAQVVARHKAWFAGERRFLTTIIPQSWDSYRWDLSIDVKTPRPLESIDFFDDGQLDEHLAFRLAQFEAYWQTRAGWELDDDFLPVFEPRLGWAECVAAMVAGAEVHAYAQTSAMKPIIDSYETFDWERIAYDPASPWGQAVTRANLWAVERGRGRFLVQSRALDSNPSDFARACRGSDFYLDLALQPHHVHRLLERCTQAAIDLIEDQWQVIGGDVLGGHAAAWNGGYWTPGRVLGHVGDNVVDLVSARMIEELLAPHVRRFLAHFGGGVYGRDVTTNRAWPLLRGLGNVLAFKPRNVGDVRVTAGDIRLIAAATGGLPLVLEPFSLEEFRAFLPAVTETGIRAFFVVHCRDREEGRRVLADMRGLE